jgi:hypothetical protein
MSCVEYCHSRPIIDCAGHRAFWCQTQVTPRRDGSNGVELPWLHGASVFAWYSFGSVPDISIEGLTCRGVKTDASDQTLSFLDKVERGRRELLQRGRAKTAESRREDSECDAVDESLIAASVAAEMSRLMKQAFAFSCAIRCQVKPCNRIPCLRKSCLRSGCFALWLFHVGEVGCVWMDASSGGSRFGTNEFVNTVRLIASELRLPAHRSRSLKRWVHTAAPMMRPAAAKTSHEWRRTAHDRWLRTKSPGATRWSLGGRPLLKLQHCPLPPHTSSSFQVLDVIPFGRLKSAK